MASALYVLLSARSHRPQTVFRKECPRARAHTRPLPMAPSPKVVATKLTICRGALNETDRRSLRGTADQSQDKQPDISCYVELMPQQACQMDRAVRRARLKNPPCPPLDRPAGAGRARTSMLNKCGFADSNNNALKEHVPPTL